MLTEGFFFATTVLKLLGIVSRAENPQVNNAWRCNRGNDPKKHHSCRKGRAAKLYCHDRSKCGLEDLSTATMIHRSTGKALQVYYCPDEIAAKRIGMTCDTFPFYNGGYPIAVGGLNWDSEWEEYHCTKTLNNDSSDDAVCVEWSSHEDSATEYEVGTYTCTTVLTSDMGRSYCQTWTSIQKETKKCQDHYGCSPNCQQPTYCQRQCCGDSSCYDCSYTPFSEYEYSNATCTKVNEWGACLEWMQEEYDQENFHFREYEHYTCEQVSQNQVYCRRWVGEIDSLEEFEISTCECLDPDSDARFHCDRWVCFETGYSYFFPNLVWTLLPITVGGIFLAGFMCCMSSTFPRDSRCWVYVYIVVVCIGANLFVAHFAGFSGLLIVMGTTWILYPLLLLLWGYRRRRHVTGRHIHHGYQW